MFEEKPEKTTQRARSRAVLWAGAALAIALTALVVLLARSRPQNQPVIENLQRAGAGEFDRYKEKVEIEIIDKIVHPNMIGMAQYEIKARLHNRGDRILTGVELVGKMFDMEDKVINESVSLPIPRARTEPLKPGESMQVSVKIDGPANISEAEIKDLAVELRGLKFD